VSPRDPHTAGDDADETADHPAGEEGSAPDDDTVVVHEYEDDDYDPAADRRTASPAGGQTDTEGVSSEVSPPRRTNVKRVVLGIVGLVASLLLLNAGLNILSQPGDSPTTSIPPRPRSSSATASTGATLGSGPGTTTAAATPGSRGESEPGSAPPSTAGSTPGSSSVQSPLTTSAR